MKRILSIILFSTFAFNAAMAQRALMIKHADGVTDVVSTAVIDSLKFSEDGSLLTILFSIHYEVASCPFSNKRRLILFCQITNQILLLKSYEPHSCMI